MGRKDIQHRKESVMGIFQWIMGWSKDRKIEDWAETVAARSLDAIWESVHQRASMLGGNTLRGYIRARGSSVIRAELDRVEQFVGVMSDESRRKVVELVLDDLTRRVMLRASASRRSTPQRRVAA